MSSAARKDKIPFNPDVMKWARERRNIAVEDAANRIKVSPERVVAWESGDKTQFPTIKQARKLANYFDRPFLEFFSKEIPKLRQQELAPDFRFHRVSPNQNEISTLKEVQIWAEETRLNALDLMEMIGETAFPFPKEFYCNIVDNVDEAAKHIRNLMDFPIERQLETKSVDRVKLPAMLNKEFEKLGVLVLKQTGISKLRTRGICLYNDILPIIVFGKESPGATAFTLVHEFAHILLRQSALSSYPRFGNGSPDKKIEGWCNRFAASFLMPSKSLEGFMKDFPKGMESIEDEYIDYIAKRFCVSPHAALIRLVNLGFVNPAFYWRIKRPVFIKNEEEFEGRGRAKYYGSRFRNSRGDLYTGLVLEAWNTGRITNHNAAEFMGIKNLTHLNDIRSNFWGADV